MTAAHDFERDAQGWAAHAAELASFYFGLANRLDVWGGYYPAAARERFGIVRTFPDRSLRWRATLTPAVLERHFIGADVGHLAGLHAIGTAGTSMWGAVDVNAHTGTLEERSRAARARDWLSVAMSERAAVLEEFSGRGCRLWIRFARPVDTAPLFEWLQGLAARCSAVCGLRPATYPGHVCIPPNGYGSWLRLPGRHHTERCWSQVRRPGGAFVSGEAAALLILSDWPATPACAVPSTDEWPVQTAATP